VTNHHCVYGSIQYNSRPGQDYLTDGFLAKTNADELQAAPGSRIYVIEDLRDVTAAMNKGVTSRLGGLDRYNRLESNGWSMRSLAASAISAERPTTGNGRATPAISAFTAPMSRPMVHPPPIRPTMCPIGPGPG
jgi:hypothetical protein